MKTSSYKIAFAAGSIILGLVCLLPVGAVALRTFVSDGQLTLAPIINAFSSETARQAVVNTVLLVLVTAALSIVIGGVLAWLNERTDARMGLFGDFMPIAPYLLPPVAGAIGWVVLLSPGPGFINAILRFFGGTDGRGPLDVYSWGGLIFVYTIYLVPFSYLLIASALRGVDPALEEQALISGAGRIRIFARVTLPSILPAVTGSLLLIFWSGFGMVSVPIIIATGAEIPILSVTIAEAINSYPQDIDTAVGLSVVAFVAVLSVWLLQRFVIRKGRFSSVGGKGARGDLTRLGPLKWVARGFAIAWASIATILPMVGLLLVALTGYWTPDIKWSNLSFDAFTQVLAPTSTTGGALMNSVELGIMGATLGTVAAVIIAIFALRISPNFGGFIDAAVKFPATTLPNIVIAVGFILAFAGPPFALAGTTTLLLLAFLAFYIPVAAVSADTALSEVRNELPEAAQVSGAGEWRTLWRVYLPLMIGALLSGWALLFARILGDVEASAILAGPTNQTVGFALLQTYQSGNYAGMAALALVMTAVGIAALVTMIALSRLTTRWRSSSIQPVIAERTP